MYMYTIFDVGAVFEKQIFCSEITSEIFIKIWYSNHCVTRLVTSPAASVSFTDLR